MWQIKRRARFQADVQRQRRRGKDIDELLAAVELLTETGSLPDAYRPHRLEGEWAGVWECHIEQDWLLIYAVTPREVVLIRTGTHLDLFE
jgi:mRNA interferase YafQ